MDRLAKSALSVPVSREVVSTASATGEGEGGPASAWVGEVVGARGPLSSVVLIVGEDSGLYGTIRYLDRRTKRIRNFEVRLCFALPAACAAGPSPSCPLIASPRPPPPTHTLTHGLRAQTQRCFLMLITRRATLSKLVLHLTSCLL